MKEMDNLLTGKKGLIMGVGNDRSIAWGIAQMAHQFGAKDLMFTYQSEILKKRVEPLAQSLGSDYVVECDVNNDASLDALFKDVEERLGGLDFIVHSLAFSDRNELRGRYLDTSRDNFKMSLETSCYSLVAIAKRAEKLMKSGGSIITMTYIGAEKVIPNYNVMGVAKAALEASVKYLAADMGSHNIRVNAISSGPIKTLAASAIGDFGKILEYDARNTPLGRNVSTQDVAGTAVYLLSDLSSGVTGEIVHVDAGYHVVGMFQ